MKIRILGSASRDLIEGYSFYERQAEGVGSYFLDSLYSDIDSLIITAGMHSVHFDKYHRLLSRRFPFAIYYRVEGETVLVYAVLDCRRDPAWIRKRLG
ncbi:MAG: type II toxin-antitoxin system RelE/ParE family toxin [Betaproteobacteria bacterium]|nr:type II toxin-antitoxin system RelE/ParE family toxin [Betaproteobacteria bacterium]